MMFLQTLRKKGYKEANKLAVYKGELRPTEHPEDCSLLKEKHEGHVY
jgi:hypothetical protein